MFFFSFETRTDSAETGRRRGPKEDGKGKGKGKGERQPCWSAVLMKLSAPVTHRKKHSVRPRAQPCTLPSLTHTHTRHPSPSPRLASLVHHDTQAPVMCWLLQPPTWVGTPARPHPAATLHHHRHPTRIARILQPAQKLCRGKECSARAEQQGHGYRTRERMTECAEERNTKGRAFPLETQRH